MRRVDDGGSSARGRRGRSRSDSENAAVPVSMAQIVIVASRNRRWLDASWREETFCRTKGSEKVAEW